MKSVIVLLLLLTGTFPGYSDTGADSAGKRPKTIYFFSGLGADESPFVNLDLPGYKRVFISWIPPLRNETLSQYAGRISAQVTDENPHFIGLSFGGILAIEVAKQVAVDKMVLISSAKTKSELSPVQHFFMRLGLYRIIPGPLITNTNFLTNGYFGARSVKEKKVLTGMLRGTDVDLFRWGLKSISNWDNEEVPARMIHIHGTADRVIAYKHVRPDYSIKDGSHLMVVNRADTISKIIMNYFEH